MDKKKKEKKDKERENEKEKNALTKKRQMTSSPSATTQRSRPESRYRRCSEEETEEASSVQVSPPLFLCEEHEALGSFGDENLILLLTFHLSAPQCYETQEQTSFTCCS